MMGHPLAAGGEKGLLDCLLDPDFSSNDYFYCYYSPKNPDGMRISRFEYKANQGGTSSRGILNSETVLWQDFDGYPNNGYRFGDVHYGGQLSFGPDGHLYATQGDKTSRDWVQSQTNDDGNPTYAGCIIRITKNGNIPGNNYGKSVGLPACWAYGIRNGFRAWWDVEKDRYYIGEVGGNEFAPDFDEATEDLHVLSSSSNGANLGWPICAGGCGRSETPQCDCNKHDDPIFWYEHTSNNKGCIIGGFVYRTQNRNAQLEESYIFGDYVRSTLRQPAPHSGL